MRKAEGEEEEEDGMEAAAAAAASAAAAAASAASAAAAPPVVPATKRRRIRPPARGRETLFGHEREEEEEEEDEDNESKASSKTNSNRHRTNPPSTTTTTTSTSTSKPLPPSRPLTPEEVGKIRRLAEGLLFMGELERAQNGPSLRQDLNMFRLFLSRGKEMKQFNLASLERGLRGHMGRMRMQLLQAKREFARWLLLLS